MPSLIGIIDLKKTIAISKKAMKTNIFPKFDNLL
jgi:hypothetical protein